MWTCQLTPVPVRPDATPRRSFDLTTGGKDPLEPAGDNSACNDFAIGPDKALYITDTANSKIYKLPAVRLPPNYSWSIARFCGIDGITFLNGTLYVNNVFSNNLYRIPVDAAGKAETPVDIWMDQPVKGPDGMRAANGKLIVAENGSGKISVITVERRQGQRDRDQGRTQDADRSRTGGRHDLDRRARRRQGRVDPDAKMSYA